MKRLGTIVAAASLALAGCVSGRAPASGPALATAAEVGAPPTLADGLWAILDDGCAKPEHPDPRAWPLCASAVWLRDGEATVVHTLPRAPGLARDRGYRARFQLTAGDPLVAKIGKDPDGWVFVALTAVDRDRAGRLIAAEAAPVACLEGAAGAVMRVSPGHGGCETASAESLRQAARASLDEASSRMRLAWISPGAP